MAEERGAVNRHRISGNWSHGYGRWVRFIVAGTMIGIVALVATSGGVFAQAGGHLAADCPQPRFTGKAPPDIYAQTSPLAKDPNAAEQGAALYRGRPPAVACVTCHGEKGDGKGKLSSQFNPPPRNFTCTDTINGIPDGQLFWIIRNGSPGTAMPPVNAIAKGTTDEQVWQLVAYLRTLARQ